MCFTGVDVNFDFEKSWYCDLDSQLSVTFSQIYLLASAHTTGDKVVIAELVLDMVVVQLMMRVFVSSYIDVDEVAFISFEI